MKVSDYCVHSDKEIAGFCNEYLFLSNFYKIPIWYEDLFFPSVENAYQSMKFPTEQRKTFSGISSSEAKKLGGNVKLPNNWEDVKLNIMKELVSLKFNDMDLRRKLFDTEYKELIELNHWKDYFWGLDWKTRKGENNLGKILMEIRSKI